MLSVEPGSPCSRDEKLATVGVGPRVRHRQAESLVFQLEVFISEGSSPDRSSSRPIIVGEVPTLNHEAGNYSMEGATRKSKCHSIVLPASLAESHKVLHCFWSGLSEHIDNDITAGLSTNFNGKCHLVSNRLLHITDSLTLSKEPRTATINSAIKTVFIYCYYFTRIRYVKCIQCVS